MKKVLAIILSIPLLIGLTPVGALANSQTETLSRIDVISDKWELLAIEAAQLSVNAFDALGNPFAGNLTVTYESINPYVAIVDVNGLVTAVREGATKVIVTAAGAYNTVSKTVSLSVAQPSDRITFENMPVGEAPAGMQAANLATVSDFMGCDSAKSVYLNDNSNTQSAFMQLRLSDKENTFTLDFDVYSENGAVALKLLNGIHNQANTAFWIRFTGTGTFYYSGSGYIAVGTKTLKAGAWSSVHIEFTNTDITTGQADIYIDGELAGTALKPTGAYGSGTGTGLDSEYFLSSGAGDMNDRFYIDNLKFAGGISPLPPPETPQLSIELGGIFELAGNTEPILDDAGNPITDEYIIDDYKDGFGYCHVPYTFIPSARDKVFVNYSRHRDQPMDYPWDSTKIFDPALLLSADDGADLSQSYVSMKTSNEMFLMSMTGLKDGSGRYFAQNYMPYYIDNTAASTVSWLIDPVTGEWEKVNGIMDTTGMGITGPVTNSTWNPVLFAKGIEILDDGIILHTMYGRGNAYLVESPDNGRTWRLRSIIAQNDGTHFNTDGSKIIYYEPSLQRCKDGSLLSIIRTDSYKPLYQSRSYDNGYTWSRSELLPGVNPNDAMSIYPQTLLMDNGVLALTTGRPGDRLLFSLDGCGYKWGYPTVTMAGGGEVTTGNTSIAVIDDDTLLHAGDRGFIQLTPRPTGIWGRTVKLTRNTVPNPEIDSAILFRDKDKLALGQEMQLDIRGIFDNNSDVIPENDCTISYYSESPELASADTSTGRVTALAEGPVRFTAAVTHNGKTILTNTIELLVVDEGRLYAADTGITEWVFKPGDSGQISVVPRNILGEALDGVSCTYESSDPAVATVSEAGLVTAVGYGVANITITMQKGADTLTKGVAVIVHGNLWEIEDFEGCDLGNDLPDKFTTLNTDRGWEISGEQAYSGEKSLFINDNITDVQINVARSIPATKGQIIELMIYPEYIDHALVIGLGTGGRDVTAEAFFIYFNSPLQGKTVTRTSAYSGGSVPFINQEKGLTMRQWNKVRFEISVDKPGRLYVNDEFIANIPLAFIQSEIKQLRFTTAGTTYVDDVYYIDDVKVASFSADISDVALSEIRVDGQNLQGFDANIFDYTVELPAGAALPVVTAEAVSPEAQAAIRQAESGDESARITVRNGGRLLIYTVRFEWRQPDPIPIEGVTNGNHQAAIHFSIKSPNGKGYSVYVSEGESPYTLYKNVNFNAHGAHVKKLINGHTYYAYVTYSENGIVTMQSEVAVLNPGK